MSTIADVARAAGVSAATVSYVLNDGPRRVRPATRARVLEVIRQLNYEPSAVAQGLRRKRMNALGVVVPHARLNLIRSPYFAPVLDGILEAAMDRDQNVTLFSGQSWPEGEKKVRAYSDGRCDGLLLITSSHTEDLVSVLQSKHIPLVLAGATPVNPEVPSVDVDNVAASYELTRFLLDHGHRRIAYLAGTAESSSVEARIDGHRRAICESNVCEAFVMPGVYDETSGYLRGSEIAQMDRVRRPTAVMGGNDDIAFGAMRALQEHGIHIPGEISVVGFDDTVLAGACNPTLTTMRQPLRAVGSESAELLMDLIDGARPASLHIILPTELVIRGTVGPAPVERAGRR